MGKNIAKLLLRITLLLLAMAPVAAQARARLSVLSSRPDMVTAGDALIAFALPAGVTARAVKIYVNGRDQASSFAEKDGAMIGVVRGLVPGRNVVTAVAGGATSRLVLVDHDRNGPIFSGPHQRPFICETASFKLPDGSMLGAPLDADCNAPTNVMYVYRPRGSDKFRPLPEGPALPDDMTTTTTLDGRTVNYIVRVETGTINRAIYQMAVLHDPTKDAPIGPAAAYNGWNGRAVFVFGGGATAGYHQGDTTGDPLDPEMLSRGFAVMSSSLNVMATVGSDVVSAETASMVKEHFIETFGPPRYVIGWGGSGGSMQQHLIANNYPGILDGIIPGASFPDLYSLVPYAVDCALMDHAFKSMGAQWTDGEKRAASGLNTWSTCRQWVFFFTPKWMWSRQADPILPHGDSNCHWVVPRALTYDRTRNPDGARCDIFEPARNVIGFDPATGQTYRTFDNIGVQYGLKAYRTGAITAAQFVELNEAVGGFDRDGDFQAARSAADVIAVRRMYATGRINEGQSLGDVPIIDLRSNPGADGNVHDAVKSETMRARLIRANGNAKGQVIVRSESGGATAPGSGAASLSTRMNVFALLKMDAWLSNMANDPRRYSRLAAKVAANRPRDLPTDVCFMADGSVINEASTITNTGRCGSKLPYFDDPRLAAGAPLTNDILKCQLRPFRPADYPGMAPALVARLGNVFAAGVCDYSRASVGYAPRLGTWLSFPRPGTAIPFGADR